jgi:uridine kinase
MPIIIAIAGGSGSGKTWLARQLLKRLRPHAAMLSLDDFYHDLSALSKSRRAKANFDSPAAIDWAEFEACLHSIQRSKLTVVPRYDFASHTRKPKSRRWLAKEIILVEGLWPWCNPRLQPLYGLKLFRAGDTEIRFNRRLKRDTNQRNRTADSVAWQWRQHVEPMYVRHVLPQLHSADVVVEANTTADLLDELGTHIKHLAANHQGKP